MSTDEMISAHKACEEALQEIADANGIQDELAAALSGARLALTIQRDILGSILRTALG